MALDYKAQRPSDGQSGGAAVRETGDRQLHATAASASPATIARPRLRPSVWHQLATFGLEDQATLHDPDGRIFVRICNHFWAVIDWPTFRLEPYEEAR